MPKLTLFNESLNLVNELKSTIDGGRLCEIGATRCTKKFLQ